MAKKRTDDDIQFLRTVKKLTIAGIFSDDGLLEKLVLKGGNLLDLVLDISLRASTDVDLSMDGDFDGTDEELRTRIQHGLDSTFNSEGFTVFDLKLKAVPANMSDDTKSYWGGYQVLFKVERTDRFEVLANDLDRLRSTSLAVGKSGSTNFSIDISKHEYCGSKVAADVNGYTIFTYTPQMFVCEKIRAICQQMESYVRLVNSHSRARARDFVDIYTIMQHHSVDFEDDAFHDLISKVFAAKRVPVRLIGDISESREYHRPDFAGVLATVSAKTKLKEFDVYFDFVCNLCAILEPLWDE